MKNAVIITAAGTGNRFGGTTKKQFQLLAGRPILFHAIDRFISHGKFSEVIIILPEDEIEGKKEIIENEFGTNVKIIAGGTERQLSVMNGLNACSKDVDLVAIHDGVRPFVTRDEIDILLAIALETGAAIPVTPVKYTLKRINDSRVIETVNRESLFEVHTPQIFCYELIYKCHSLLLGAEKGFTDDAGVLEYFGYNISVKEISAHNLKITTPFDLQIAEIICQNWKY